MPIDADPPASAQGHDPEDLREALLAAASLADPTERLLEVAAVIGEALADLGIQPVVVGGLALAYWASGDEFITGDIDVLLPRVPGLAERLERLGFAQEGREWRLHGYDVSFEAPGDVLEPGDEAEWAELASGRHVKVLSIEDMLLWRLREWLHWHHASGFHQAAHLLLSEELDGVRLARRAKEEGLKRALQTLRALTTEIEGGRVVEEWEIVELGREVERQSYSPNGDD